MRLPTLLRSAPRQSQGTSRRLQAEDAKDWGGDAQPNALSPMVPKDRGGTFSNKLLSRYQRKEKARMLSLILKYVEGVSATEVIGAVWYFLLNRGWW